MRKIELGRLLLIVDKMLTQSSQEPAFQIARTISKSIAVIKLNLQQLITLLSKQHQNLNELSLECTIMECSLASIESIAVDLAKMLREGGEKWQTLMLSELRPKQCELVIDKLKLSLNNKSKKQEKLSQQLAAQKQKIEQHLSDISKLSAANISNSLAQARQVNRQFSSEKYANHEMQQQLCEILHANLDKSTTTQGLLQSRSLQVNTELQLQTRLDDREHQTQMLAQQCLQEINHEQKLSGSVQNDEKIGKNQVHYLNTLMGSQNLDENFGICDEEELNIGQTAVNLQIKDVFNSLRKQIEKILNEEDISIDILNLLPAHLEDDFSQFMAYIKQKISEIKCDNNLSFIAAETGSHIQTIDEDLANFIKREPEECAKLRELIEQKEGLITILTNERTQQQNTINQLTMQKEEMDEQSENRFANQCKVYKQEIVALGEKIALLEMSCHSLRKVFKNTVELWTDDEDNLDDIRDNVLLYFKICRVAEPEKRSINQCLEKYRRSKMKAS